MIQKWSEEIKKNKETLKFYKDVKMVYGQEYYLPIIYQLDIWRCGCSSERTECQLGQDWKDILKKDVPMKTDTLNPFAELKGII